MVKIGIIGGGISGLSAAKMLTGDFDVVVLEKRRKPGGLIRCENINGNLYHKVGGHIFNSKIQSVLKWFWNNFDKERDFHLAVRNARILLNDQMIGYPIENHVWQLNEDIGKEILSELLDISIREKSFYSNFKDFLSGNFGKSLYELYFRPYNEKIWKCDLGKVPLEWLQGKLPMPDVKKILHDNIYRISEKAMVHSNFYYPINDGSQFLINSLLKDINTQTDYEVKNIQYLDNKWVVNGELIFNHIIYTGDIRNLIEIIINNNINGKLKDVSGLKSNSTSNILCEGEPNNLSWMYIPDPAISAHRIIYTGNFSDNNNRTPDRKSCVVEFTGKVPEKIMVAEINKLPGDLTPIKNNYEEKSYIIQERNTQKIVNHNKKVLQQYNFHLLGRFAEWEYYNMDNCIFAAMRVIDNIKSKIH